RPLPRPMARSSAGRASYPRSENHLPRGKHMIEDERRETTDSPTRASFIARLGQLFGFGEPAMPSPADALPGRAEPISALSPHFVSHRSIEPPYPEGMELAVFA